MDDQCIDNTTTTTTTTTTMSTKTKKKNNDNHTSSYSRSMSDADSQISESFHTPPHSVSPFRSETSPSKALVAVSADKYYSPSRSPPRNNNKRHDHLNYPPPSTPPPASPSPKLMFDKAVKKDVQAGVTKVGPPWGSTGGTLDEEGGGVGGERSSRAAVANILRRSKKDVTVEKAALGFRVFEVIFCLISFSVMAADKTQGWSGDSFDRYKEYRYCLSVSVIAFVYSGFQAYDLAYQLGTGKHVISHHLRYHFDFLMDQILAYLLLSASSASASKVDDWVSNWGKDKFTEMTSASIGMSFLAFVTFALSCLISGYNLCNRISGGL